MRKGRSMLQSIKQLYGNKLGASDGEIGHVKDFYFDDQNWAVRYVVADTGSWLPGRQVLISPHSLGGLDQAGKVLRVNLTRKQIEDSPSIESHKPVSRQYEEEYYRYYGWPYYWQGDGLWGMSGFPILELPPKPAPERASHCDWPATRTCRCASAEHASRERLPYQGERWNDRPRLRFYDGRPELGDSSTGHQNRAPVFRQGSADTDAQGGPDQLSGFHGVREFDQGSRRAESRVSRVSIQCGRLTPPGKTNSPATRH